MLAMESKHALAHQIEGGKSKNAMLKSRHSIRHDLREFLQISKEGMSLYGNTLSEG